MKMQANNIKINTILVPQKQLHENAKTTPDSGLSTSEGGFQHHRGFSTSERVFAFEKPLLMKLFQQLGKKYLRLLLTFSH